MKKLTILSIAVLLVLLTNQFTNAQTQSITVDTTITADCEFDPFTSSNAIHSLKISGNLTLNSDTSLVRIVLYDTLFNEYMVYESYHLIASEPSFNFYDVCDETCYLDSVSPYSLEVQIVNASLTLNTLLFEPDPIMSVDSLQLLTKQAVEQQKIAQIQSVIDENEFLWFADTNTISNLNYSNKKSLFGEKYNMRGLDYYSGGIFMTYGSGPGVIDNSSIIPEWDWRNRHGANDPEKDAFYYDGIENGKQGWMTRIKNQNVGGCNGLSFVYGTLAAIEAVANVYFNTTTHKDYDLSIQHYLDCGNYSGNICEYGGNDLWVNTFVKTYAEGIYQEEDCYERALNEGYPAEDCKEDDHQDTDYKIRISDFGDENYFEEEDTPIIKETLIQNGPLASTVKLWEPTGHHTMALTGYGRIDVGDVYHDKSGKNEHVVGENSPYLGYTYWIYKNSWGDGYGDKGYFYLLSGVADPWTNSYYVLPIIDLKLGSNQESPAYYDLDQDGYWNWGISDIIPSGCPETDTAMRDSDDSEPGLGPFDEDYYSIPVSPIMEVRDAGQSKIPPNTFYSFYDGDLGLNETMILEFTIENNGNAQLNLFGTEYNPVNVHFSGKNATDFTVYNNNYPNYEIPYGTSQTFYVEFTLTAPITETKVATLTIDVEEEDREDYIFNLIFTDCSQGLAQTQHISSNETWSETDEPYLIFSDLQIDDGVTLTINEGVTVAFVEGANMFVERGGTIEQNGNRKPGGKVYVNGGLLTSFCGMWNGVDVGGYGDESQLPDQDGDYSQGYIKLYNGGTISNALVGIETRIDIVRQNPAITSGGIVILDEGQIVNCTEGIVFYPYENFNPYATTSEHQTNLSSITLSNFYNDRFSPLIHHLKMWGVDGINIRGCTFLNKNPVSPYSEPLEIGINSLESSFTVEDYTPLLPLGAETVCTSFKNFAKAIRASNNNAYGIIKIDSVFFDENLRGIYMSTIDYPEITNNTFNVRKRFSHFPDGYESIGLYLDNLTTGFLVEENRFYTGLHQSKLETVECGGITINNSGEYYNELYNNSFESLTVGIASGGTNRNEESDEGLCIKCNDFKDCLTDVYVATADEPVGSKQGIALAQGQIAPEPPEGQEPDPTLAAGNIFSKEYAGFANYYNDLNCYTIVYTHHYDYFGNKYKIVPEPTYPLQPTNHLVLQPDENVQYNSKDEACPSNFGSGGVDITMESSMLASETSIAEAYTDTLGMYVDGGDTEELNLEVSTSFPDESIQLRQQLLDESPYLSDTVMKSAIAKEDVLLVAMLRDVLVANPQSAKSPDVMNCIDSRSDTMPAYMMNQIMQGQNIIGAKEMLTQKLSVHKTGRDKSFAKLMLHYLADTVNPAASRDSIINLLQSQPYPGASYQLALHCLNKGDSANAFSRLDIIETEFELTTAEEALHELYTDLMEIIWEVKTDTTVIDSIRIMELFDIADYSNTLPGIYAANILINIGELTYEEPVYFPPVLKVKPIWNLGRNKVEKKKSYLSIFPNPAGNYFTAEYQLLENPANAMLVLSDLSGNEIKIRKITGKQNQIIFPTEGLVPGTYLLSLLISGKVLDSRKVIIIN